MVEVQIIEVDINADLIINDDLQIINDLNKKDIEDAISMSKAVQTVHQQRQDAESNVIYAAEKAYDALAKSIPTAVETTTLIALTTPAIDNAISLVQRLKAHLKKLDNPYRLVKCKIKGKNGYRLEPFNQPA